MKRNKPNRTLLKASFCSFNKKYDSEDKEIDNYDDDFKANIPTELDGDEGVLLFINKTYKNGYIWISKREFLSWFKRVGMEEWLYDNVVVNILVPEEKNEKR